MERNAELDIVKGLGIISVVLGHLIKGNVSLMLHLFHMPLFFIVSGYLHKPGINQGKFFKNKVVALLLPYFVYLLLFTVKSLSYFAGAMLRDPEVMTTRFTGFVTNLLWGGEHLKATLGVFWFVTCLFVTQQLYNFVLNRFSKKVLLSLAGLFYLLAIANQHVLSTYAFPWGVNIVLCAFLFYTVGNLFGDYIFKHRNAAAYKLAIVISLLSLTAVYFKYRIYFDMKHAIYGWAIVSPLAAISITKTLSFISAKLKNDVFLGGVLSFAGKASITVMFVHQFIHYRYFQFCNERPWEMSLFILSACMILHYVISSNSILRYFLLGARQDRPQRTKSLFGSAVKTAPPV